MLGRNVGVVVVFIQDISVVSVPGFIVGKDGAVVGEVVSQVVLLRLGFVSLHPIVDDRHTRVQTGFSDPLVYPEERQAETYQAHQATRVLGSSQSCQYAPSMSRHNRIYPVRP